MENKQLFLLRLRLSLNFCLPLKILKVSKHRARQAMQGKWETDKIIIKRKKSRNKLKTTNKKTIETIKPKD